MDIYLRIKELRERENLSKKEFSTKIGIDNSQYGKIEAGKLTPTIQQIMDISSIFGISTDWLIIGKGEMPKEEDKNIITKIHKPTKYMEKILESQEITLYDISAAANLKTLFIQKEQNVLGKIMLPNMPKCDGALYATGDSMYPLVKSGDIICYKEIHEITNIVYGEMYLVSMNVNGDEYLTLKYITRSDLGIGWVRLESYNKFHSPQDFQLECINALALVKISIRINTMI